jgi:hypothetical protein
VAQCAQLALGGAETIGEVEAGEDGGAGGIEVAGAAGDVGHKLIDFVGEGDGFFRVARRAQGVRLIEDRHTDDLFGGIRRFHGKSLNWR